MKCNISRPRFENQRLGTFFEGPQALRNEPKKAHRVSYEYNKAPRTVIQTYNSAIAAKPPAFSWSISMPGARDATICGGSSARATVRQATRIFAASAGLSRFLLMLCPLIKKHLELKSARPIVNSADSLSNSSNF